MKFDNVAIKSIAHIDAPHIISSEYIENKLEGFLKQYGLRKNIIQDLTGIKARRFWDEGVTPSQVATEAAKLAIEKSGVPKEKIGVIINSSVCKDYIEPSVACLVHGNLGLSPDCLNFDVGNACLAFLNSMTIVGNMLERGQIDYALVVDGEGSRFINETTINRLLNEDCNEDAFRDSLATFTLGSGAVAMVLCRSDLHPDLPQFKGGVTMSASQHNQLCLGQVDEMKTDGTRLLIAGLDIARKTYQKVDREFDWSNKEFSQYIIHQVSRTHTQKICETLNLDQSKVYKIFQDYGNIGPAAIPIVLSKVVEENLVKKGERIALLGIGSGLNCSMMEIVW